MKRNYTTISRLLTASVMLVMVSAIALIGQTPTTLNYQAVLRDTEGNPRSGANVIIELEIHQATETGIIVYSEAHNTTTTDFGIVNLEIGSVSPASFETIDWSAGPYFVEVSIDETSMGVSELLTVPYALYAATANIAINDEVDDADADPTNELNTTVVLNGTDLEVTDAGGTIIEDLSSLVDDADPDPTNELQQLSIIGGTIYLDDGGSVVLPVVGPSGAVTNDLISFDGANWVARGALIQNSGGSQSQNNMQPWTGINHVIAVMGLFPSRNGGDPFLAEIYMFGGNFAPRGYAMCDGQLLGVAQNSALFSLLGTTFGGDGRTTFGLPDLRGRTAVHPGSGPGLSTRRLGERGGTETNTMTIGQMPVHRHTITYQ